MPTTSTCGADVLSGIRHWRICGRTAKARHTHFQIARISTGEFRMSKNAQKVGWIGTGRMGLPMAERLLKAGHDVTIWNRTREKAEPLSAKGGKVVERLADLASVDVLFSIVSTG